MERFRLLASLSPMKSVSITSQLHVSGFFNQTETSLRKHATQKISILFLEKKLQDN